MQRLLSRLLLLAALAGTVGTGMVSGQGVPAAGTARLEAQLAELRLQNATLKEELISANQREQDAVEALRKIKLRLEALGKNLIDGGDDRIIKAVSDYEVLNRRHRTLEGAALHLTGSLHSYLKTAIAADPDARAAVELSLREVEIALGIRNQPRKNVRHGDLQNAKVVSIDPASGLVVVNVGEREKARIGLQFNITRGGKLIGEAMVASTREDVSGLLVQRLENEDDPVRFGDIAALKKDP